MGSMAPVSLSEHVASFASVFTISLETISVSTAVAIWHCTEWYDGVFRKELCFCFSTGATKLECRQ